MVSKVTAFFTPPVFPDDGDRTMAAGMLHYAILFGLIAILVQTPALLLSGDSPARILLTSGLTVGLLLMNIHFLRRGHVRASALVFLGLGYLILSLANLTAGGVEAPGYPTQVVFVICAGFIFGGASAFLAATISALVGLGFLMLQVTGRLPPSAVANTAARHWVMNASTFFVVAAILTLMVNRLRATIAAGRREIVVRQEAERELERHRAGLEDTVRERTSALVEANRSLQEEIRDRRRAEEALRREKDFVGQLMETSPVGILVVDAGGAFTFANAAAARVLGRRRDEIVGSGCAAETWRFTEHGGQPVPGRDLPFLRVMTGAGAVRNVPLAIESPDGKRTLLSVNAAPLGESQDHAVGAVATVEDVTERLRIELELFRTQKLESVGVLAGGIAHDFNNLLTAIMGNISLAQFEIPADSPAAGLLADAEKASLQARDVTQQLLTFSRGGAPVKRAVAVGEIVANAAQFALLGTRVRADLALPPGLWGVDADQGQLGQVFHNLAINACQAMPEGGTLSIRAGNVVVGCGDDRGLPPGNYVEVTVADEGVGIPEENLGKIFDPFFTTKPGGTGLGLAVAYSVIRNHGGHLAVESAAGKGSTFTIHLPATARALPSAEPRSAPSSGCGRILLMDDEPMVRQVAVRILEALGYEAQTAADGAEALAAYRGALATDRPFSAVILDLTVPGGMGGEEAVRELLALDPAVKAIVSSGYSNDPVMSSFRDFGFRHVLAKPYHLANMSRVLRQVLETS